MFNGTTQRIPPTQHGQHEWKINKHPIKLISIPEGDVAFRMMSKLRMLRQEIKKWV